MKLYPLKVMQILIPFNTRPAREMKQTTTNAVSTVHYRFNTRSAREMKHSEKKLLHVGHSLSTRTRRETKLGFRVFWRAGCLSTRTSRELKLTTRKQGLQGLLLPYACA